MTLFSPRRPQDLLALFATADRSADFRIHGGGVFACDVSGYVPLFVHRELREKICDPAILDPEAVLTSSTLRTDHRSWRSGVVETVASEYHHWRKEHSAVGEKWYREGLSFSCTQCGNCCSGDPGYVWASKEEVQRISQFLGRTDKTLDREHLRRVGLKYSLTEKPDGECIFLVREDGKSRCGIYPVRPLQCRTWPFWDENLRSAQAWERAHRKCPGMDSGQHHEFVQIETIRKQRTW